MSEQIKLFEKKPEDVKPELYYITWNSSVKEKTGTRIAKGYGVGKETPIEVINLAMNMESGDDRYPHLVQTGVGVLEWLNRETIPDPTMKANLTVEVCPKVGNEINFLGEGTFVVKSIGIYKEDLYDRPYLVLTSLVNGYDMVISLKALNHKLLRKTSPHKNLNFTLLDSMDNWPAYWFTIGYLLDKAYMYMRTTPGTDQEIQHRYKVLTGCEITPMLYNKFVYFNDNKGTFTHNADMRILVDKSIRSNLYFPKNKVGKREGILKKEAGNKIELIQNTDYVWTLFHYGFRLGEKHNREKVFEYVKTYANSYLNDFKGGFNYDKT